MQQAKIRQFNHHWAVLYLASLLLSGCASSLSETGKVYQIDVTPQMQIQADRLRNSNPPPNWQTTVQSPEIEELLPLANGRVLVGFMNLGTRYPNSSALSPYPGPYVVFDTTTGEEIWRHQRENNPDLNFNTILADTMVVYTSRGKEKLHIVALDAATGVMVWEKRMQEPVSSVSADAQTGVVAVSITTDKPKLMVLDLKQGTTLWSSPLGSANAIVEFTDTQLTVLDNAFNLFDAVSGLKKASVISGKARSEPAILMRHNTGYLVAWSNGEVNQVSATGKRKWRRNLNGIVELAALSDEIVVLATRQQDGQQFELLALSLRNGKSKWRLRLAGKLYSYLLIDGDRMAFTTEDKLTVINLSNGQPFFEVSLHDQNGGRLPDHLRSFPQHYAVASETSVSAHSRKTGQKLWSITLSGVDYLTQSKARFDLTGSREGKPANALAGVMNNYANGINSMLATSDLYARQARQNYQNVYNQTRMAMSSGTIAERADASFQRSLAASHMENVNTINRSFDSMMLATQTALNVLATAQAVERNAQIGAEASTRDRAFKRLLLSQKIHETGLQGDYYMRPFISTGGSGMVVVNLVDGSWVELSTSPAEKILQDRVYLNVKLGLLTDNNTLISMGTGLNPDRWQVDERFRAGTLSSTMFAFALEDRYRMTLILRSLMAYRFSQLTFQPAEFYTTRSLTKRKSRIIK